MHDRLPWERPLGAVPEPDGQTTFRVWAPRAREVVVEVGDREVALTGELGVFEGRAEARAGDGYRYRLDGGDAFADPCSRDQPEGVRGPSRVVDPAAFEWDEGGWGGLDRRGPLLYELHVGTFTAEGTFAAAPEGLAGLVAAAHRAGLGVILDVVYNHLGPGNEALEAFGPYHTDRYDTPWGA